MPGPLPVDCQVRVRFYLRRESPASRMLAQGVAGACVALVVVKVRFAGGFPSLRPATRGLPGARVPQPSSGQPRLTDAGAGRCRWVCRSDCQHGTGCRRESPLFGPLPVDCQVRVRLDLRRAGSVLRMLALGVAGACVALVAIAVRVAEMLDAGPSARGLPGARGPAPASNRLRLTDVGAGRCRGVCRSDCRHGTGCRVKSLR